MYNKPTVQSFTMEDIREHIAAAASNPKCANEYNVSCSFAYVDVQIPLPVG